MVTAPSAPEAIPATVTQSAPDLSPASSGLSPNVRVFVNGEEINSLDASQSSALPSLPQNSFATLLKAMSVWAAGSGSDNAASGGASQLSIWNAVSQAGALSPAGRVYATSSHALKMARLHRTVRR
jgi:hypothetical protein